MTKQHFAMHEPVKKKGDKSQWRGRVCGFYSTDITKEGIAVESAFEPNSVQIYPASALEKWTPSASLVQAMDTVTESNNILNHFLDDIIALIELAERRVQNTDITVDEYRQLLNEYKEQTGNLRALFDNINQLKDTIIQLSAKD